MNAEIKFINPTGLYDPSENGYTHVVIAPPGATTVYISGQGGEDEKGNLAIDNFIAQLKQAFTNLRIALAAAGASPKQVVKTTMLIVNHDEAKLQMLMPEIESMWGKQPPACTLIPVPRLALDGMLFEIEATAVIATNHQ